MESISEIPKLPTVSSRSWVHGFVLSAGLIFALTGLVKAVSAGGHAQILNLADPVFNLSFRHLMLGVGSIELITSAICFSPLGIKRRLTIVNWLAISFTIYRLGLWVMGWQSPCPCLGTLTDSLSISRAVADGVMKICLAYLLLGSLAGLWYEAARAKCA